MGNILISRKQMELELQKYLRAGKTLEDLHNEYGIHTKAHFKHSNLIGFKYDQLDSPKGKKLVQQCRGTILDSEDNWKVIAYPFDRFFNYNEGFAADINYNVSLQI